MGVDSFGMVGKKVVQLLPPRSTGKVLKLSGVGFRVFNPGGALVWGLGYSHYVGVLLPGGAVARPGKTALAVTTPVGDLLTRVVQLRRPDPYKARGIYPVGQKPPTKEGKRR